MNSGLEQVKAGDVLIRHGQNRDIVKVSRTTKTQIVLPNGDKYRKETGFRIGSGSSWHRARLAIPKDGEIGKIQNEKLHEKLVLDVDTATQYRVLKAMPLTQLKQLRDLLELPKGDS